MPKPTVVPLILSGGSGTRLWPLSRANAPKPFMRLPDGETLLAKTVSRAAAVSGGGPMVTVTRDEHYFATRDAYAELGRRGPRRPPLHVRHRADARRDRLRLARGRSDDRRRHAAGCRGRSLHRE